MSAAVIEFRAARLGYGSAVVLPAVDLTVGAGECLGIVGPNGCGKTTLLRAILGAIAPQAGTVEVRARVGYCPQRTQVNTTELLLEAARQKDHRALDGVDDDRDSTTLSALDSILGR